MRALRLAILFALGVLTADTALADGPRVVFLVGEREYDTRQTLPEFAKTELEPRGCACTFVFSKTDDRGSADCHTFPGLEAALDGSDGQAGADVLFVSVRRRYLAKPQLERIRKWVADGRPLVAVRTASHAFASRDGKDVPEGHATWPTFDVEVLGGKYEGHYGSKAGKPRVRAAEGAASHAILAGVDWKDDRPFASHLYKNRDLAATTQVLLEGRVAAEEPSSTKDRVEPVAWTNVIGDGSAEIKRAGKGRVFYTSLGGPEDMRDAALRRMLVNAIFWTLDRKVPAAKGSKPAAKPARDATKPKASAGKSAEKPPSEGVPLEKHVQRFRTGGLSPKEAHAKLTAADDLAVDLVLHEPEIAQPLCIDFDERGRMWVVEYRQYPHPAGLRIVSHDTVWRSVYDKVPHPPGHPDHVPGRDRISIHEDTNGDGTFDRHKVFVDGLNITTAVARGRGGVWVLNPPYLLFYADADGDDRPDGDPEVRLAGFGLEDTHSVVNSLRWGPDGWLYAAQGSTVSGNITRPGLGEKPVFSQGQLIWRYHPETRRYEIFAEGGGNTFGVELDAKGRIFSGTNEGDRRGYHYVQGSYSRKNFGKHGDLSNPHAYGHFPGMAHHKVKRFTHTFIIYEADRLPAAYRGTLLGVHPLGSHVVRSRVIDDGSTFKTEDVDMPLTSSDDWFRPVDIKQGPDGAVYVADWYDGNINHWKGHLGLVDPTNGRIYRLRPRDEKPGEARPAVDMSRLPTLDVVALLESPNKWTRQTALRVLGDRKDAAAVPRLREMLAADRGQMALEALWALNLTVGLDDATALSALAHADPHVRAWTVRLLCDDRNVSPAIAGRLVELAVSEPHVEIRSQLACSGRRLPAADSRPIVASLLKHDEDVADPHLPLLAWWAVETLCREDPRAVVSMLSSDDLWHRPLVRDHVLERLMRRFATEGRRADLLVCAALLAAAPDEASATKLLAGFDVAFRGRTVAALPDPLAEQLARHGGGSLALRVRRGDAQALDEALILLADAKAKPDERARVAVLLGEVGAPVAVPALLGLVADEDADEKNAAVRRAALAALRAFDDDAIADEVVRLHDGMPAELRSLAQSLLVGRAASARRFLVALDEGSIARDRVDLETIDALRQLPDDDVQRRVRARWGELADNYDQVVQAIDRYAAMTDGGTGDLRRGQTLFRQSCGKCHVLHREGGKVGPDLTSYNRGNTKNLLLHVVHPSAEIREGFRSHLALTDGGRVVTGLVVDQDERVVVLRGHDGQDVVLERDALDEFLPQKKSLMPDGLLANLTEQQVRDLVAYLQTTQPIK